MHSKQRHFEFKPILFTTLGVALLSTNLTAAAVTSNNTTSVSTMTSAGWSCVDSEDKGYDLNSHNFNIWYQYLANRAVRNRIRAEHIVCELGTPTIDRKIETNLSVLGYDTVPGEHVLIYGKDITASSNEKNALMAYIEPNGLVRQLVWIKPESQEIAGVRINTKTNKFSKFEGTYKLGDNDVFQQ